MQTGQELWESLAAANKDHPHIDKWLGRIKRDEFLKFFFRHTGPLSGQRILKTDLREEAYGGDDILFADEFTGVTCLGLDISGLTVWRASLRARECGRNNQIYMNADVRKIPLADDSLDLVLSTSTLDHFSSEQDTLRSFQEIKRVLKPGGRAIISLNNKQNLNFVLMLKLEQMLKRKAYPVRFFGLSQIRRVCGQANLEIEEHDFIVNIISPLNSLLLLLRRCFGDKWADRAGRFSLKLAGYLSRSRSKAFTAWFIIFSLRKAK